MNLNDIKLKRLAESAVSKTKKSSTKRVRKLASGQQGYSGEDQELDDEDVVVEGEKDHHTPKFVQHCVAAIAQDPAKLAKVQQRKDGSPFGICQGAYNRNKGSLAAKHAQGRHHSVKDYEKALEKLREAVEARHEQNVDPRTIAYVPRPRIGSAQSDVKSIRYEP